MAASKRKLSQELLSKVYRSAGVRLERSYLTHSYLGQTNAITRRSKTPCVLPDKFSTSGSNADHPGVSG
eukprot:1937240-Pleurochrysis_carterae.AAC.1